MSGPDRTRQRGMRVLIISVIAAATGYLGFSLWGGSILLALLPINSRTLARS
ncbi:MAG: hypothetical protein ACNA75_05680 [Thiohalomonadaceae bacterium]